MPSPTTATAAPPILAHDSTIDSDRAGGTMRHRRHRHHHHHTHHGHDNSVVDPQHASPSPQRNDGSGGGVAASSSSSPLLLYNGAAQGNSYPPAPATATTTAAAPSVAVAGIAPRRRVLLCDHVTNTGAVVTLEQVDYSDAMRAYRVCRQSAKGAPYDIPPALRLLSMGNLMLHAAVLVFLLPLFTRIDAHARSSAHVPVWLRPPTTLTMHHNVDKSSNSNSSSRADSDAAMTSSRVQTLVLAGMTAYAPSPLLLLLIAAVLLLIVQLVCSARRVYVEELLVIHGVGMQLTSYGAFNTCLSRRFIDLRLIRSIVIHDAFWRYQPIFFLSSSIENWPRRLVYFDATLPRLVVLRTVLRGMRHILYGPAEEGRSLAEMEEQMRDVEGNASDATAAAARRRTRAARLRHRAAAAAAAGGAGYYWLGGDMSNSSVDDDNDDVVAADDGDDNDDGDDMVDEDEAVDMADGTYRRHHGNDMDDDDDDDEGCSNNSNLLLLHPFDVTSDVADDEY